MTRARRAPILAIVPLVPSRLMVMWLMLLHALALVAALAARLPLSVAGAICTCVGASAIISWRRWILDRAHRRIVALSAVETGQLEAVHADGELIRAEVLPGSTIMGPLTTVAIRLESGRREAIVVLPDSTGPGDRRRLRAWLRWAGVRRSMPGAGH